MCYDVVGLGAPVVDQVLLVSEEFLSTVCGEKGGQVPIDYATLREIIDSSEKIPKMFPGGSSTNTIKGLGNLGRKCALIGMIGSDKEGENFSTSLLDLGIVPLLAKSPSSPTSQVLCMVTPDGERTMRSYLAASTEMTCNDLSDKDFKKIKLLHVEGYGVYNMSLLLSAMDFAKEEGAKISLDLASFEVVQQFKREFLDILDSYVDVVFANEKEVDVLFGLGEKKSCQELAKLCEVAVVLMGGDGCYVSEGSFLHHCPAFTVPCVIDSTGAGDLFAGGFLHGYLGGIELEECARYGALLGAEVIQSQGAEIPLQNWEKLQAQILSFT